MLLPPEPDTDEETLVEELKVGGGGGGGVDTVEMVEELNELLDPPRDDEDMFVDELLKSFFSFSAFFISIWLDCILFMLISSVSVMIFLSFLSFLIVLLISITLEDLKTLVFPPEDVVEEDSSLKETPPLPDETVELELELKLLVGGGGGGGVVELTVDELKELLLLKSFLAFSARLISIVLDDF